jgi:hypothetical protein
MGNLKLTIELVPEQSWGINLAHILTGPVWDTLRKEVYAKAHWSCEICGNTGVQLHCHEVWEYNDKKHIQTLVKLQCLCVYCHDTKHWGRTVSMVHSWKTSGNYLKELEDHFCKVNQCKPEVFLQHKVQCGKLWQIRSKKKYKVDFGDCTPEKIIKLWKKENRK